MKKRGISPLIAAILLITFTIIIFTIVSSWIRKESIQPQLETGEEVIESSMESLDTNIKITKAETSSNIIKLTISNEGTTEIESFNVIIKGDKGTDIKKITLDNKLKELDVTTEYVSFEKGKVGNLEKIEVNPLTSSGSISTVTGTKTTFKEDSSLVAYYSFDNQDATDDSENENNGELKGGITCTKQDEESISGYACNFDGGNDHIEIPHNPSLNPPEFTIQFWAKGTRPGNWYRIMGKNDYWTHKNGWIILWGWNNDMIGLAMWDANKISKSLYTRGWNLNDWTHIVYTYKYPKIKAYRNSNFVNARDTTGWTFSPSEAHLRIGKAATGSHYRGIIDEVKIYNRALTEEEIKSHYEATKPLS